MSAESMSNFNVSYRICPRCGNPLQYINGTLACRVCGYIAIAREKIHVIV